MALEPTTPLPLPPPSPPAHSLLDLPGDVFALVARHLTLSDVCQLRVTCRTMLGYSALLAGACVAELRMLFQDGAGAPEAVLAWAVGGDLLSKRGECSSSAGRRWPV